MNVVALLTTGTRTLWFSWWAISKTCATCERWTGRKARGWRPRAAASFTSCLLQSTTRRWCSCSPRLCAMPVWEAKPRSAAAAPAVQSPWPNSSTTSSENGGNLFENELGQLLQDWRMRFIKLVYIVPHCLLSWPHSHYRVNLTKHQEHGHISPQSQKKTIFLLA